VLLIFSIDLLYELKVQQPFIKKNCGQIMTYEEALTLLAKGAKGLDADRDGRPCEQRFNLSNQLRVKIIAL
jgi:hypothetical protein